jgi:hypothetical protein
MFARDVYWREDKKTTEASLFALKSVMAQSEIQKL